MDNKEKYFSELHSFVDGVDKEVTMLLQSLQWDRKHLLEGCTLVPCRYDANHRVPPVKKDSHEKECFLRREGYTKEDQMLPDLFDSNASTVVKLSKEDIQQIIDDAAQADPTFQRGPRCFSSLPLTAERLQATYTADERRAIHDVVVSNAPDFEHVEDIDLTTPEQKQARRNKSKLEVLAELRNMRRRRAKYRCANTASNNYSNVLRDLIKTQMELYTGVPSDSTYQSEPNNPRHTATVNNYTVNVKQEPLSEEENERNKQRNRDTYQQSDERDRRNNYQQHDKDRYRRDDRDRGSHSQQDNTDKYQRRDERDRRNNYQQTDKKRYRSDDTDSKDRYQRKDERNYRRNDDYRRNRDISDRRHRDTERQPKENTERQPKDDRERARYERKDDYSRRDEVLNKEIKEENSTIDYGGEIRIKEEKVSDDDDNHSQERSKDKEANRYKNRDRNKHKEIYSNLSSRDRYPDSYSKRGEHSTEKRYSRNYDNRQSKSRKEYPEESSSKDTHSSRKHKHNENYGTTDSTRHERVESKRSRSRTREIDYKESYKDDKYKRYYDMKRALQAEDAERKKHS